MDEKEERAEKGIRSPLQGMMLAKGRSHEAHTFGKSFMEMLCPLIVTCLAGNSTIWVNEKIIFTARSALARCVYNVSKLFILFVPSTFCNMQTRVMPPSGR